MSIQPVQYAESVLSMPHGGAKRIGFAQVLAMVGAGAVLYLGAGGCRAEYQASPVVAERYAEVQTTPAIRQVAAEAPAAPVEKPAAVGEDGLLRAEAEDSRTPVSAELDEQLANASREPLRFVTDVKYLTPNRPVWLEAAPNYEGEIYKVAVKAGPFRTVRDCEPDLEQEVQTAVAEFINDHLNAKHASTFIGYSLDELRRRKIVREQFSEQLQTSFGLMNQVHAQLVFDDSFRDEIDTRWREIKSKTRLAQTGLGAGVIFLLLTTLFSYFKLDTATKGYYTGRLQFATAGAILTLVAASVLLAKWIPWM